MKPQPVRIPVKKELNRMCSAITALRDIGDYSDWKRKQDWRQYMDLVDQLDEIHTDLLEQE